MRLLAAALLVPLLAVPAAHAGTPASCSWVTDPPDDATGGVAGQAAPRSDSGADIKAIGLASGATGVATVLRLNSYSAADSLSPTGRRYDVTFTARTGGKDVAATVSVVVDALGHVYATPGSTFVKTDPVTYEIRLTMPLTKVGLGAIKAARKKPKAPGDKFVLLAARTRRWEGDLATGQQVGTGDVDTASGTYAYEHRTPSCVTVGQ